MNADRFALRGGMTAIELMIVLAVIITLTGMTVPAVVPLIAKARAREGAGFIDDVARQARLLAMTRRPETGKRYGVVVVPGAQAYAALTYGANASAATILRDGAGDPVLKRELNRNLAVYDGNAPAAAALGWMYHARSGFPAASAIGITPVAVGLAGSPVCADLSVRSLDLRNRVRIAVYTVGVAAVQEF